MIPLPGMGLLPKCWVTHCWLLVSAFQLSWWQTWRLTSESALASQSLACCILFAGFSHCPGMCPTSQKWWICCTMHWSLCQNDWIPRHSVKFAFGRCMALPSHSVLVVAILSSHRRGWGQALDLDWVIPNVSSLIPHLCRWDPRDELSLQLDTLEQQEFGVHDGSFVRHVLTPGSEAPCALHAWGSQLRPCPCGCRS